MQIVMLFWFWIYFSNANEFAQLSLYLLPIRICYSVKFLFVYDVFFFASVFHYLAVVICIYIPVRCKQLFFPPDSTVLLIWLILVNMLWVEVMWTRTRNVLLCLGGPAGALSHGKNYGELCLPPPSRGPSVTHTVQSCSRWPIDTRNKQLHLCANDW